MASAPRVAHVQLVKAPGAGGDKLRSRTWIEVELIGEDNGPIPGQRVEVELPGGRIAAGTLDDRGCFRVEGFPGGMCKVRFPDLDKDAWVPIAPTAAGASTAGNS